MHIGITGSRNKLPDAQLETLYRVLTSFAYRDGNVNDSQIVLHHGCCTGADEHAHKLMSLIKGTIIVGHPGKDARGNSPYLMDMSSTIFGRICPRKLYNERNRDIVNESDLLIACPAYPENDKRSQRSGTWQTVRIARNIDRPVICIMADGSMVTNYV